MSPTGGPARPDPKARTLARGQRRYRRKIASAKEWQAIIAAKAGPCRVCGSVQNGRMETHITFHHVRSRAQGGDDVADNIVPVCVGCHEKLTRHEPRAEAALYLALTPEERAYVKAPPVMQRTVRETAWQRRVRRDRERAAHIAAHGNRCQLCGNPPKSRGLSEDHDHATGAHRGWLCFRCNRALPAYVDAAWLRAAADYLERAATA
jgi:hypothetical protein